MRTKMRAILAGIAAIISLMALATPAQANDQSWSFSADGLVRARASFDDAANRVYVTDVRANDGVDRNNKGAMIDVWRVGNRGGQHVECYAPNGSSNQCGLIWVEDTHLEGRVCWIEAYFSYRCGVIKDFYS